ncbi:MAG: hypothetical protein R3F43_08725 [bacterium]
MEYAVYGGLALFLIIIIRLLRKPARVTQADDEAPTTGAPQRTDEEVEEEARQAFNLPQVEPNAPAAACGAAVSWTRRSPTGQAPRAPGRWGTRGQGRACEGHARGATPAKATPAKATPAKATPAAAISAKATPGEAAGDP